MTSKQERVAVLRLDTLLWATVLTQRAPFWTPHGAYIQESGQHHERSFQITRRESSWIFRNLSPRIKDVPYQTNERGCVFQWIWEDGRKVLMLRVLGRLIFSRGILRMTTGLNHLETSRSWIGLKGNLSERPAASGRWLGNSSLKLWRTQDLMWFPKLVLLDFVFLTCLGF